MAKISLKKGGKTVNGKFVANAPKKTTSKVATPAPTTGKNSGGSSIPAATLSSLQSQLQQAQAMLNAKTGTPTVTPTTTAPVATKPTVTPQSSYTGNSIVDYLSSAGQASDYANRAKLAAQAGIKNYTGSAEQNTQLLTGLRTGAFGKIDTSGTVPSTAITSPTSPSDVLDRQKQLAGLQSQLKDKQTQLADLLKASQTDPMDEMQNPITEPDKFLSQYFSMDAQRTATGKKYDAILGKVADDAESFYKGREDMISGAYDKYDVKDKQENLSKIQKEMAEREVRLRNEIQTLETAPEYRGVSREFAIDQRESIKSKGAFDLANLAIVESAYRGDLETSRSLAQELIDNQFASYEAKNDMYKAQLAALMPQLDAEEKQRALAIEVALDERSRRLADAKADKELLYDYASIAASMGAPTNITKSILSAKSADEAFLLAAPYMKEKQKSSSGTSSALAVGGGAEMVPGVSPFNSPLADSNFLGDKMADIKSAVIAQFSPTFSTKLQSSLTDEQLRDFLIKYDAYQRQEGMNVDPQEFLAEYLASIGKTESGSASSSNLDARIDAL